MNPQKAFYGLLALTIGMIAAGVGVYYYFNNSLLELNHEVGELLAEQEVVGTQIRAYESTQRQINELSFVEDLANDVLPQTKEQANVVAEIKQFITDAGLQLQSINFSGASGASTGLSNSQTEAVATLAGVRVLPAIAVIAPGATYNQVLDLLQRIENNQRKMQVTEVSLTPVPGSDTLSSVSLGINIYLRSSVAVPVETPAEETP